MTGSDEKPPLVSVVVPNYNHAAYLEQRLFSIFNQSFKDFEVIFLDDASSDNSLAVAELIARKHPMRMLVNSQNSGTPFAQWNRGVALARGELVWIAESDDVADPDLLGRLVDALSRHPDAGLAYCQSRRIDESGHPGILAEENLRCLHSSRWLSDFVADGRNECRLYLSRMNTIANASAVLFRKSIFDKVGGADESFRMCGDWHLWCRMLSCSDLAFLAAPLNQHRLHSGSVRSRTVAAQVLIENGRVLKQTHELVKLPRRILRKAVQDLGAKCVLHMRTGAINRQDLLRVARIMRPLDPWFLPRLGPEWFRQRYALRKKAQNAERNTRTHTDGSRENDIYFLFRDSPLRQTALHAFPDHPARYSLYGMDLLTARGWRTGHNLASVRRQGRVSYWSGFLMDRTLSLLGGSSGDFTAVLASLHAIRSSGLVVATVDSLGVPLLWLRSFGMFFTPIVYVSIGFPERLRKMSRFWQVVYKRLLRQASAVVAYGFEEAEWLRHWLGDGAEVRFIPFGVDTQKWRPAEAVPETLDVLAIGADPMREFSLLAEYARRYPDVSVCLVTVQECVTELGALPANMRVHLRVPIEKLSALIAGARVVVLPVKENTYSGATTTLLQCMAMGKAVAVSQVGAIREGYGFEDGVNLRWMKPGSLESLSAAVAGLLADGAVRRQLGGAARRHVVEYLGWDRYVNEMEKCLSELIDK